MALSPQNDGATCEVCGVAATWKSVIFGGMVHRPQRFLCRRHLKTWRMYVDTQAFREGTGFSSPGVQDAFDSFVAQAKTADEEKGGSDAGQAGICRE